MWEVDPLECPNCGAEIAIVSFLNDAPVVEKILKYLKGGLNILASRRQNGIGAH